MHPTWPAHWLKAVDKSGHSASLEVTKVREVSESGLQFIPIDAIRYLERSKNNGAVSCAWVFGVAAEDASCDACSSAGGPMPPNGCQWKRREN